jgi:hypothetical protein
MAQAGREDGNGSLGGLAVLMSLAKKGLAHTLRSEPAAAENLFLLFDLNRGRSYRLILHLPMNSCGSLRFNGLAFRG